MQLTKCFLPDMIEKREGRILNMASVASLCAGPYMSVYYATKAFVRSFSEAVAEEVREYGVTVTALCPGPVDTGFEKAANVGSALAFNALTLADPRDVAICGYRAMMKGKTLTYYGVAAKAMALAVRVLPRSTARRVAGKLNKNG
jgi:short-subunit dehydrogenase